MHWAAKHGYEFRHHDNDADMRVGNSRAFVFLLTDDEESSPPLPWPLLAAATAVERGRVEPEEEDGARATAATTLPTGGATHGIGR